MEVSHLNESQELGLSTSLQNLNKGRNKLPSQRRDVDLIQMSARINSTLPQIYQSRSSMELLQRATNQEEGKIKDEPGNLLVDHRRYKLPKLIQQAQQESWVEQQHVTSTEGRRLNQSS